MTGVTFTLPSVAQGVLTAATVDLTKTVQKTVNGVTQTIPVIFPVLFGTAAQVLNTVQTTYAFAPNFALSLVNQAETTITAALGPLNILGNANANFNFKASGSASGKRQLDVLFNSQNSIFTGLAYSLNVPAQVNTAAVLVHNVTDIVLKTGETLLWAFFDDATNTVEMLTDSGNFF